MKVNVGALAASVGLVWGGGILIAGLFGLAWPGYGASFLHAVASLYPGYDGGSSLGQVLIGTGWGLADGAASGLIAGGIYNALAR